MLKDIIIIDNVFDDIEYVLKFAKEQTYYSLDKHPTDSKISHWVGYRSKPVFQLNQEVFDWMNACIFKKMMIDSLHNLDKYTWHINRVSSGYFHYLTEHDKFKDSWFHIDSGEILYAGVVYLHKSPEPKSGTTLIKNEERIEVENIYNRLVLYRSDYYHAAQRGFGKDVSDSRLTFTFFIHKIVLQLETL